MDRTPDGVYADWNQYLGKDGMYSVGVYRRFSVLSRRRMYQCGQSSFKRIVRWMLSSEAAGNGRCFLEGDGWCYESAWAVSQIGK
jgi:hypothetical protein